MMPLSQWITKACSVSNNFLSMMPKKCTWCHGVCKFRGSRWLFQHRLSSHAHSLSQPSAFIFFRARLHMPNFLCCYVDFNDSWRWRVSDRSSQPEAAENISCPCACHVQTPITQRCGATYSDQLLPYTVGKQQRVHEKVLFPRFHRRFVSSFGKIQPVWPQRREISRAIV